MKYSERNIWKCILTFKGTLLSAAVFQYEQRLVLQILPAIQFSFNTLQR